ETRYFLEVTSRGRLANATTDTNAGADYQFQTSAMGDVLLVVGGGSFPPEREASYAAALGGNAWTWSLWRVAELGLPPLPVLQARRAVIWQVGLEQYPPFNASARTLVQNYLDGGGRLIVSSHDSAWALGSTSSPFATAQTEAWVRAVLKATFVCDPKTVGQAKGVSSDPISGSYVGGVVYTPHRDGGADDQFSPSAAGGTVATDWTDNMVQSPSGGPVCAQNQPIGLRWVSSSPTWTARAHWTGVVLSNFTLESSADGGLTWTSVACLPGSVRDYTWNIGAAPNGNRYHLRILAHDNGTPSLSSSDVTDTSFAINRP